MDPAKPWLDQSLYEDILQSELEAHGGEGRVTVVSCGTGPDFEVDCNYCSTIIKVKVKYTIGSSDDTFTRPFFIKAPLQNKVFNEDQFFRNEIQIYEEVFPKIHEIGHLEICPNRYNCKLSDCLVMDDLNEAGYSMCDSRKRLDLKHVKAVLVSLAKFHAASVAVKHQYPGVVECNGVETVYTHDPKYSKRLKPRILMRLYAVAKVLQTMSGCKKYGDILINAGEAFWDLMAGVHKPNSKVNVLNHGDLWTNNILFKYDSTGAICDVKLVDYQMRRYGSPALDLLFLFWTSADDGVRMRMYELLEMYRHTLNSSFAELACSERLSRQDLKEEISKRSPIILMICLYLPVIFPDPDQPFSANKMEVSEESMSSYDFNVNPILIPFKSKYYRYALPEMCKELETMKIFQIMVKNYNIS